MCKKRKLRILVCAGVMGVMLAFPVFASVIMDFGTTGLEPGKIQYYWYTEPNGPNNAGKMVSPTVVVPSESVPCSPFGTGITTWTRYSFWGGTTQPTSATIYLRIWDDAAKARGSHYSNLSSYANPLGSGSLISYGTISTPYIYQVPAQAIINQYEEASTAVLYPAASTSRKVTFSSMQTPGLYPGYTVQIKETTWKIKLNDTSLPDRTIAGTSLVLNTNPAPPATPDTLNPGDVYKIKAIHKNYWDEPSATESTELTYTVGAGPTPGVGGALTVTCNFLTTASLGINQFMVPFSSGIQFQGPVGTSPVSIANMQQLVDAINDPTTGAGAGTVKTAGWWDKTAQVMVGWTGIDGTVAAQNGAPATLAGEGFDAATMDKVYQMSVARPVSFTLTGTR